jgi:hypothetical protein
MNKQIFLAFALAGGVAIAQSVIISAPNVDITPKGEVMVAHESQFNRFSGGKNYWNSFTFGTVGLGKNTEFATTLYGLGRPSSGNNSLGFGLKHRPLNIHTKSGWHIESTAGFMVPVSLSGNGTGYWFYGNVGARAPKTKTRITAGPSFGTRQIFGRRTYSTMLGIEQPLNKHWILMADYFSGTHDLAAAIGGIAWVPQPQVMIIFAYKVPNNAASGKPAPLIEATYTFGHKKK